MQNIKTRIKHKINSKEAWESSLSSLVLLNGELAFVRDASGGITSLKVGDGETPFSGLDYVTVPDLSSKQDILVGTGQDWRSLPSYTPKRGQIVVWSDKASVLSSYDEDGTVKTKTVTVPGFKVGDGTTSNVNLPFVGDEIVAALAAHEQSASHITDAERSKWNYKICIGDPNDPSDTGVVGETLVLTRN